MKIRWRGGSVRFRITPSELAALLRGERVEEELALPGGGWLAMILPGAEATHLNFARGDLQLGLSEADRARLAAPDTEGVYFETSGETPLRYYIEKDFPCAHPGAPEAKETPAETFAPPPGFKERHRTCT